MNILSTFYKNFPEHVKAMKESDHNYSNTKLNAFHQEGDVWTHTMMVYNQCPDIPMVQLAALLHDVGKPACEKRNPETQRVSFIGHEGMSYFLSCNILNHKCWSIFTIIEKQCILMLIANHSDFYSWKTKPKNFSLRYNGRTEEFELLKQMVLADVRGRIAKNPVDSSFIENTELTPLEFPEHKHKKIIVMVGLPGCGKSTLSSKLKGTVISRDSLVLELVGNSDYSSAWESVDQKEVDKALMKRFHSAVKTENTIIIDMTNLSLKSRRKWLSNEIIKREFTTICMVFPIGIQQCISRCTKRIKLPVYEQMAKSFTLPMQDEFDFVEIHNDWALKFNESLGQPFENILFKNLNSLYEK